MPEFYVKSGAIETKIKVGAELDESQVAQVAEKAMGIIEKEASKGGRFAGHSLSNGIEQVLAQRFLGMSQLTPAGLIGAIFGGLGLTYSIQQLVTDIKELYQETLKMQVETTAQAVWGGTELEETKRLKLIFNEISGFRDKILGQPVEINPFYVKEMGDVEKLLNEMISRGYKFQDIMETDRNELAHTINDYLTVTALANSLQISVESASKLWLPVARHLDLTNEEAMKQLGIIKEIGKQSEIALPTAVEQVLKLANAYELAGYQAEKAIISAGELRLALPEMPFEDLQVIMKKLTPTATTEQLKLATLIGLPANMEGIKRLESMETGEVLRLVNDAIERLSGGNELTKRMLAEKFLGVSGYALDKVSELTSEQIDTAIRRAREAPPLAPITLPYETFWESTWENWIRRLTYEGAYGIPSQGYGVYAPYQPLAISKFPVPETAIQYSPTVNNQIDVKVNFEGLITEDLGKKITDTIKGAVEKAVEEENIIVPVNP